MARRRSTSQSKSSGSLFLMRMGLWALLFAGVAYASFGQEPQEGRLAADGVAVEERSESASSGDAKDLIPTRNLLQIFQAGGPVMYPIALCSLLLVAFTLERLVSLRRGRNIPGPFVTRFLEQLRDGHLDRESALKLCEENGSPIAQVFAGAVRKWGRPSVEVEQAVIDSGERTVNGFRKYLRLINAISNLTPLMGLLGTVTGMIGSFNTIATASAMGKPELLAAGIGEALITTAAGLFVAIPATIIYLYLVSRVDKLIADIDALGQKVVHIISLEAIQAEGQSRGSRKTKAA
jgi:biopolymer transport protein ExbB